MRSSVAEVQEGIAEAERRARLARIGVEDRLKQEDGFVRMAVPSQLFRPEGDVPPFRRIDLERLAESVHGVREPAASEQEVCALEPGLPVPPVEIDDARVTLQGLRGTIQEDEQLRAVEPHGDILGVRAGEPFVAGEGGGVVAFRLERMSLLAQPRRSLLVLDLSGGQFVADRPGKSGGDPFALCQRHPIGAAQHVHVGKRHRDDVRGGLGHAGDRPEESEDLATGHVLLERDESLRRRASLRLDLLLLRGQRLFAAREELFLRPELLRSGVHPRLDVRAFLLKDTLHRLDLGERFAVGGGFLGLRLRFGFRPGAGRLR